MPPLWAEGARRRSDDSVGLITFQHTMVDVEVFSDKVDGTASAEFKAWRVGWQNGRADAGCGMAGLTVAK